MRFSKIALAVAGAFAACAQRSGMVLGIRGVDGFISVNDQVRKPASFDVDDGSILGDEAAAGDIGEIKTASLAVGSATSLVTNTPKTVISLALTPGDWDVRGVMDFLPAASTSITMLSEGVSTVDNTFGADDTYSANHMAAVVPTAIAQRRNAPVRRINIAVATTIYLVANATFTVSTLTAFGTITARRVR